MFGVPGRGARCRDRGRLTQLPAHASARCSSVHCPSVHWSGVNCPRTRWGTRHLWPRRKPRVRAWESGFAWDEWCRPWRFPREGTLPSDTHEPPSLPVMTRIVEPQRAATSVIASTKPISTHSPPEFYSIQPPTPRSRQLVSLLATISLIMGRISRICSISPVRTPPHFHA